MDVLSYELSTIKVVCNAAAVLLSIVNKLMSFFLYGL